MNHFSQSATLGASTAREVTMKRSLVIVAGAVSLFASAFAAQAEEKTTISDGVVKIGMIEDMSSIYADITGVGAVTAAKMAVEDFGGTVLGMPVEVVSADHPDHCLGYRARVVREPACRRADGCGGLGHRACGD
jgi:hypothetical protein